MRSRSDSAVAELQLCRSGLLRRRTGASPPGSGAAGQKPDSCRQMDPFHRESSERLCSSSSRESPALIHSVSGDSLFKLCSGSRAGLPTLPAAARRSYKVWRGFTAPSPGISNHLIVKFTNKKQIQQKSDEVSSQSRTSTENPSLGAGSGV